MASFQGASYQAGVGPSDEEVTLFAACPPPEELGFRSSSNHWRKRVGVDEIDALWEARPIGRYRGERCMVLDDLGDRMHIAYLGRDLYLARRLGFWEVDRGVFEVVVPRQEIDGLREERGEYELALLPAMGSGNGLGWNDGSVPTWAHTPREYGGPAPDTGPLRTVGPNGLIDTGPSWAADSRLPNLPPPASWDTRDTHAEDPRDTGTWAATSRPEETPEPDDPFPRGRGGWRARDTGGWEAPDTGSWDPREVERAARNQPPSPPQSPPFGPTHSQHARPAEPTDRWSTPGYPADDLGRADLGRADVARHAHPERNWDPQDTMDWNPVSSGEWDQPTARDWERDDVVRPADPPTQDAAAVWHGSPFPEDGGRWNPSPGSATPATSPPLAIGGARPAASSPTASPPGPRYDDPPLARQAAAFTGAYGAPVPAAPAHARAPEITPAAAPTPAHAAPTAPDPSGGRYVGRRSARKQRVTTETIFAELLDLAAIPQSSYAVDREVDGAMCLVPARGGYEVFSAADRARHEVRFFEDEEAAYFYLFGVLAADAIRNGQLGPKR
ncbi:MAG TPA: hypothetical protein VGI00_19865 [Streptosporangiaceae bacterium]